MIERPRGVLPVGRHCKFDYGNAMRTAVTAFSAMNPNA